MSSRDGSILLAMSAFQSGQFRSIRAAAHAYNVPPTSLARRISGVTSRADFRPKNTRLAKSDEAFLIQEILKLDAQGYGSSLDTASDIASSICEARGGLRIGVKRAGTFVKRTRWLWGNLAPLYGVGGRGMQDG